MTRYQKLFVAALLFCIATYAFIAGIWQWRFDSLFSAKVIFGFVIVAIFAINQFVLSAEGTKPYDDAQRMWRENVVLRRALKMYADGLDDAGSFAADVLSRLPNKVQLLP